MATTNPTATLSIDRTQLHYVDAGSRNARIVLLIHGSLCDYRYWKPQVPALSSTHRVLAPSLRGYWPDALQTVSDDFSVATHAQDMETLLAELSNDRPAHIVGHSRGAQVALELARRAPWRVQSLTLADPGFRFSDEPPGAQFHSAAVQRLQQGDIETAMQAFVNAVNGQDIWNKMVPWFKRMVKDNALTLLSQLREIDLATDPDSLAMLSCPVLLVGGQNSPERYKSRIRRLGDLLWNAQAETIASASHGMNLANPKAFNEVVLRFMQSTDE